MSRFLSFLLLFFSCSLIGQSSHLPTLFDTLYAAQQIKLHITYPFDSLQKSRKDELPATFSITTNQGILFENEELKLNLRGKFRRITCDMPPLLLNFKKSMLKDKGLLSHDEIKLVTHCIPGDDGIQNLEEEMLCYQLYASLNPYSYRVIWTEVTYCDSDHPDSCYTSAGLLLEPDKTMELRLGIEERKLFNLSVDSLDFDTYSKMTAFNFLIGNRDWSVASSRNAKLFFHPGLKKYVVIPYDFDYANIVGAMYRKERLPHSMTHPFDRIYNGEYFEERSAEILQTFFPLQDQLMQVIVHAVNPITKDRRQKIEKYFSQWFSMMQKTNINRLKYGLVCPYKGGL